MLPSQGNSNQQTNLNYSIQYLQIHLSFEVCLFYGLSLARWVAYRSTKSLLSISFHSKGPNRLGSLVRAVLSNRTHFKDRRTSEPWNPLALKILPAHVCPILGVIYTWVSQPHHKLTRSTTTTPVDAVSDVEQNKRHGTISFLIKRTVTMKTWEKFRLT